MDLRFTFLSFEGRIGRLHYIAALLLLTVASVATTVTGSALFRASSFPAAFLVGTAMAGIAAANVWAALAVYAKRLHDVGVSGWGGAWILGLTFLGIQLLPLAPKLGLFLVLVSGLLGLVLTVVPGESRENGWGQPPHAPVHIVMPAE